MAPSLALSLSISPSLHPLPAALLLRPLGHSLKQCGEAGEVSGHFTEVWSAQPGSECASDISTFQWSADLFFHPVDIKSDSF